MTTVESATELPILLIYTDDPSWEPAEREAVHRETCRLGRAMRRQGHRVRLVPVRDRNLRRALAGHEPGGVLIFNWCEAIPGLERSEAQVPAALERLRFTYTGAPARVLKLSYDKVRVKRRLETHGIPTPRWRVFDAPPEGGWDVFPAIVKPAREHCSVGVDAGAVVTHPDELRRRVAWVTETFSQPALVEDFIDGREFHVSLWGNDPVEVLPVVEMDFSGLGDIHDRLCTFDSKFVPDSPAYQRIRSYVPARLDRSEHAELERICRAAYAVIGCRDYGRIDVRLRDGVFHVLDVNPNADISADASLALAAGKAGYCYGAMGSRMIRLAAERHPRRTATRQRQPDRRRAPEEADRRPIRLQNRAPHQ